jgi:hypothetical protein
LSDNIAKGVFKYYISVDVGEGGLTSIAYVAYNFREGFVRSLFTKMG